MRLAPSSAVNSGKNHLPAPHFWFTSLVYFLALHVSSVHVIKTVYHRIWQIPKQIRLFTESCSLNEIIQELFSSIDFFHATLKSAMPIYQYIFVQQTVRITLKNYPSQTFYGTYLKTLGNASFEHIDLWRNRLR